jgi:hypothetical protein
MHPGLRKAWLDAQRANETNDRNIERIPPSGGRSIILYLFRAKKKAVIKPVLWAHAA